MAADENPAIHWIGRVFRFGAPAKASGTPIAFQCLGRVVVERLKPQS